MSKIKYLSEEELSARFNFGERKLIFDDKSPFDSITTPPKTIFVAWESDQESNSPFFKVCDIGAGSVYVCRGGNSEAPFKIDVYTFQQPNTGGAKLCDVEPEKIRYHHSLEIPSFIKEQSPEWVISKTHEVSKNYKITKKLTK